MIFTFGLLVVSLFQLAHGQGQLYPGQVQGIPCLSCDANIMNGMLDGNMCAGNPDMVSNSVNCPTGQYCHVTYTTSDRVLTRISRGCMGQTCTRTDDCMEGDSGECVRCCNQNNNSTGCNTWVIDPQNLPSGGVRVGEPIISMALALLVAIMFSVWG